MRLAELLDKLSGMQPDDVIAIGVHLGKGEYDSQAIGEVRIGEGIALLYTSQHDAYRSTAFDAGPG